MEVFCLNFNQGTDYSGLMVTATFSIPPGKYQDKKNIDHPISTLDSENITEPIHTNLETDWQIINSQ
jgi:hypothetical protein